MDAEPEPEPSEPAHFPGAGAAGALCSAFLMDFYVLPYVLIMIQMNGAGVGTVAARAGTIFPEPEPKPPEHFSRAGAGAGIIPRSRSRPKYGGLRMPDFQATKFLLLLLFVF